MPNTNYSNGLFIENADILEVDEKISKEIEEAKEKSDIKRQRELIWAKFFNGLKMQF